MSELLIAASNGGAAPLHEAFLFWILAPISVAAALGMVFARSAVHSALLLAVVMLSLAAFYTAEHAPFLAVVQVVVYTGAVLMLFLFVLMLIGVDSIESLVETLRGQRAAAVVIGLGFAVLLVASLAGALGAFHSTPIDGARVSGCTGPLSKCGDVALNGNVAGIAHQLFSRYVFAFEATSALLITAGLGAMVLAHREPTEAKQTQRQRMRARAARGGAGAAPLPGPGIFADHNAVDTPALLPDGSVAPGSVPDYLQVSAGRSHVDVTDHELER